MLERSKKVDKGGERWRGRSGVGWGGGGGNVSVGAWVKEQGKNDQKNSRREKELMKRVLRDMKIWIGKEKGRKREEVEEVRGIGSEGPNDKYERL